MLAPPPKVLPGAPVRSRGYKDDYRPHRSTRKLLDAVQTVLDEYREHWPLTVRQIFYRLVGAHGFDKSEKFYSKLCHHLAMARRGRVIPFEAIRDDGVTTVPFEHYADADDFRLTMRLKAQSYRRDVMANQDLHIEIWCEAAGMIMQLAKIAEPYSIPVFSSSGFDSVTAKYDLARRICSLGLPALILHLGDFDPSGEAMFKVIEEDVGAFVAADRPWGTCTVEFKRIALTAAQVVEFGLPTAPPKSTDSRSKAWQGETCQLEALAPDQIAELLGAAILDAIDVGQLETDRFEEKLERKHLTRLFLQDFRTSPRIDGGAA